MNTQQIVTRSILCMLAWFSLAAATACAQVITHVPLIIVEGDAEGDQFGRSVSGTGDINGDGVPDLIVGARFDDDNGENSGSATVLSGADGSVIYSFHGDSPNDRFGVSVDGAGDINGDGVNDLIVGASFGYVRVLSGADGSQLYNFDFAFSASGAGDINGDGFDDLIVGFDFFTLVLSGADGSSVLHPLPELDRIEPGTVSSVSEAGDVNGDGFNDLITLTRRGTQVFSGLDGNLLHDLSPSSFLSIWRRSVRGAGDVNGDGFDDFIVGENRDKFSFPTSSVHVFSGIDGNLLYTIDSDSDTDFLGFAVSGTGDVNGDGFSDFIAGDVFDDTNAFNSGSARVFSGVDGSVLYTFHGDTQMEFLGHSVSDIGDVNGDGLADFIIGANGGGTNNGGYVQIYVSQTILLGDCNLDGVVNFSDIPAFIAILQSGEFLAEADTNEDGVVNFADIPAFIEILTNQ